MMKKSIAVLLAAALAFSCTGCFGLSAAEKQETMENDVDALNDELKPLIKDAKKLVEDIEAGEISDPDDIDFSDFGEFNGKELFDASGIEERMERYEEKFEDIEPEDIDADLFRDIYNDIFEDCATLADLVEEKDLGDPDDFFQREFGDESYSLCYCFEKDEPTKIEVKVVSEDEEDEYLGLKLNGNEPLIIIIAAGYAMSEYGDEAMESYNEFLEEYEEAKADMSDLTDEQQKAVDAVEELMSDIEGKMLSIDDVFDLLEKMMDTFIKPILTTTINSSKLSVMESDTATVNMLVKEAINNMLADQTNVKYNGVSATSMDLTVKDVLIENDMDYDDDFFERNISGTTYKMVIDSTSSSFRISVDTSGTALTADTKIYSLALMAKYS